MGNSGAKPGKGDSMHHPLPPSSSSSPCIITNPIRGGGRIGLDPEPASVHCSYMPLEDAAGCLHTVAAPRRALGLSPPLAPMGDSPIAPASDASTHTPSFMNLANSETGKIKQLEPEYRPRRPGEPDCSYDVKFGSFSHGMKCGFNSETGEIKQLEPEYPRRTGEPNCPMGDFPIAPSSDGSAAPPSLMNLANSETGEIKQLEPEYPRRPGQPDCTMGDSPMAPSSDGSSTPPPSMNLTDSETGEIKQLEPEYQRRPGEPDCRMGDSSSFSSLSITTPPSGEKKRNKEKKYHRYDGSAAPPANSETGEKQPETEYPLRPGKRDCSYYVKFGSCRYGMNCWFNHPLYRPGQDNVGGRNSSDGGSRASNSSEYKQDNGGGRNSSGGGSRASNSSEYKHDNGGGRNSSGGGSRASNSSEYKPDNGGGRNSSGGGSRASNSSEYKQQDNGGGRNSSGGGSRASNSSEYKQDNGGGRNSSGGGSQASNSSEYKQDNGGGRNSSGGGSRASNSSEYKQYFSGKACNYNRHEGKTKVKQVKLNFLGLPLRPGTQLCLYYLDRGTCKFGTNCKFHHPDPESEHANSNASQHAIQGSSQMNLSTTPIQRAQNGKFVPLVTSPTSRTSEIIPTEGVNPCTEWSGYQIDENKQGKLDWDPFTTKVFCDICTDEVLAGNRPTDHLNAIGYNNLCAKFNEKTTKGYNHEQFKSKWESLKKDYQSWKALMESEDDIGQDPEMNTISASLEWWAKKMEVMPDCGKFYFAPLENVNLLNIMFEDMLDSSSTSPEANLAGNTTIESEQGAGDGHTKEAMLPKSSNKEPNSAKLKINCVHAELNDLANFDENVNPSNLATSMRIDRVGSNISEIMELVVDAGAEEGSDEHFIATQLFIRPEHREMFLTLKTPRGRLGWLKKMCQVKELL